MATKSWTLTGEGSSLEPFNEQFATAGKKCSVARRTLRGGLSEGVDVIRVDNGALKFDVLPTRGMGLWKAWLGDDEFGWRSPVPGPVHPNFVPIAEPSGLGWLDGFDELLVRCGLESNGAPEFDEQGRVRYPLHGRIANKPARRLTLTADETTGQLTLTGVVEEVRFHFLKLRLTSSVSTAPGENGLRIVDVVENLSESPADAQLLYHVNFGHPLLDAGSRFVAPLKTVVPRNDHAAEGIKTFDSYAAPQAGFEEQVYFMELAGDDEHRSMALLRNAHGTAGASLHFDLRQLPCFTVWKNTTATGDGYVTGLEPATNYPNPRSHEGGQNRVLRLPPKGKAELRLELRFYNAADVAQAEEAIGRLQADVEPTLHDKPQPGWCEGV
ncbi:MAG: aldose 1-epimerase family protein [Pirellulaceae bacterium]